MANFPGPFEVVIKYSVDGLEHEQNLNCSAVTPVGVGDSPSDIDLVQRNAGTVQLDTAVDAWCDLLKVGSSSTMTFNTFDFYSVADLSFERTFITSGDIDIDGTNVGAYNPAHQKTLTFRTLEGGNMRIVVMETADTSKTRVPYNQTGAGNQAIMDFVVSPTNWILARDTSYPISTLNAIGGENEALFRRRFRT